MHSGSGHSNAAGIINARPTDGGSIQTAVPPQNTAQAVPTSAVSYTMDDLAKAAITLMDSGRQTELQQLLGAFGVNSLRSSHRNITGHLQRHFE
ncbi:MAG: hypothetical protein V8R80_02115 [Eubacterium sp.]